MTFYEAFIDELEKLALNFSWKKPGTSKLTLGKFQKKGPRRGWVGSGNLATRPADTSIATGTGTVIPKDVVSGRA